MSGTYKVLATTHFERDLRNLKKTEAKIKQKIMEAKEILVKDPYDQSGKYNIA